MVCFLRVNNEPQSDKKEPKLRPQTPPSRQQRQQQKHPPSPGRKFKAEFPSLEEQEAMSKRELEELERRQREEGRDGDRERSPERNSRPPGEGDFLPRLLFFPPVAEAVWGGGGGCHWILCGLIADLMQKICGKNTRIYKLSSRWVCMCNLTHDALCAPFRYTYSTTYYKGTTTQICCLIACSFHPGDRERGWRDPPSGPPHGHHGPPPPNMGPYPPPRGPYPLPPYHPPYMMHPPPRPGKIYKCVSYLINIL